LNQGQPTDKVQGANQLSCFLLSIKDFGLHYSFFGHARLKAEERTRVCHCAAVFRSNRPTQPQSGAVVFAMRITRTRHGTSTSNCWTQTPTSAGIRINSGVDLQLKSPLHEHRLWLGSTLVQQLVCSLIAILASLGQRPLTTSLLHSYGYPAVKIQSSYSMRMMECTSVLQLPRFSFEGKLVTFHSIASIACYR
jgi:hypothetical protein